MVTRVSVRGVIRALAVGLLAACPLVAADPPVRVVYQPQPSSGPVIGASFVGPRTPLEFPAVPIDHYPRAYSGIGWTRLSDQLAVVKKRNAERVPFDLKYLPPADPDERGPSVIVAVRPSAIFDRPGGTRLATEWLVNTGILNLVKTFFNLSEMNWPAIHEVDMIVARGILEAKVTDDGAHFTLGVNQAHGAVIRTRERYDWRGALARVAPALGTATYRGVEYRTTKVNAKLFFPQNKDDPSLTGLYVADDRTLVIDSDDAIERLIDRLLDAKPPEAPPGWEKVSRGVVAVAMTCPSKGWTSDLPGSSGPRLPKGGDWEWNLLDDLHELLIGLDDQPTTRFQLTATAFDPFAGKRMTWNAKRLLALVAAYLVDVKEPEGDEARAIWQKATFTPTLRGFEITADTGKDLINPLLDKYAAEAAPVLQPSLPAFGESFGLPSLKPTETQPSALPPLPEGIGGSPVPGSESNKSESDLPPIPQAPPTPGFYDRSPLSGLSGIGERPK